MNFDGMYQKLYANKAQIKKEPHLAVLFMYLIGIVNLFIEFQQTNHLLFFLLSLIFYGSIL